MRCIENIPVGAPSTEGPDGSLARPNGVARGGAVRIPGSPGQCRLDQAAGERFFALAVFGGRVAPKVMARSSQDLIARSSAITAGGSAT